MKIIRDAEPDDCGQPQWTCFDSDNVECGGIFIGPVTGRLLYTTKLNNGVYINELIAALIEFRDSVKGETS